MTLGFILAGIIIGSIINAIWRHAFSKYEHNWMIYFEHYHWAIILFYPWLIVDNPLTETLLGVGLILWLDEALFQEHSFALGSSHFMESTLIGVWLVSILLLIYTILAL